MGAVAAFSAQKTIPLHPLEIAFYPRKRGGWLHSSSFETLGILTQKGKLLVKCGVAGGGDASLRSFRARPRLTSVAAKLPGAASGGFVSRCWGFSGWALPGHRSSVSPCPPACSGPARGLSRKCPVPGFGMDVGGQVMARWPSGCRPFSKEELDPGERPWAFCGAELGRRPVLALPAVTCSQAGQVGPRSPDPRRLGSPCPGCPPVTPGVQCLCCTGAWKLGRGAAYSECSSSVCEGPGVRIPTGHTASAGAGGSCTRCPGCGGGKGSKQRRTLGRSVGVCSVPAPRGGRLRGTSPATSQPQPDSPGSFGGRGFPFPSLLLSFKPTGALAAFALQMGEGFQG